MSTEVVQTKVNTLRALLAQNKEAIEGALPRHLTAERLLSIATLEARKNPALLECTQASFLGAIIQTAQLGLEPGNSLGHAYLVPFKNKKKGVIEVQFIIGYKGMIALTYRSERVSHVIARAVYEGDKFTFIYGTDEKICHIPDPEANGKKLTHVYAIVFLKDGGKIFEVMEVKEIEAARGRSKSADDGPWQTDYEAMAKKSVIRKLSRYMPVSIEMQRAVGEDEAADRGEQNNAAIIETTGAVIPEQTATDRFMDNVGDEPPKQEAPKTEPKKPTEQATTLTRDDAVKALLVEAKKRKLDMATLETVCLTEFKKEADKMSVEEIVKLTAMVRDGGVK